MAGWVANRAEAETMSCERETLDYLRSHMAAPCLGELPWLAEPDPVALASHLDLKYLIEN